MNEIPLVCVICLNHNGLSIEYNSQPIIKLCLDAVEKTNYANVKFIVADAASSDGSKEYIIENYKNIELVDVQNFGWGPNNNEAIKYVVNKYGLVRFIVLISNDVIIKDEFWLEKMVKIGISDSSIGIITGKLTWPNGDTQFKGIKMGLRGILIPRLKTKTGILNKNSFINGAFFLISINLLRTIGLIDESYIMMNGEDIDFSIRAYQANFKTFYIDDISAIHLEDSTVNKIRNGTLKGYEVVGKGSLDFNMRVNECVLLLRYYKILLFPWFINAFITSFVGKERRSGNLILKRHVARNFGYQISILKESSRRYKKNKIEYLSR